MCPQREAITYCVRTLELNFPKIACMETKTETTDSPGPLFHPLTGLEAASRWNAAAVEWMTKGVAQWLAWMSGSIPFTPSKPNPPSQSTQRTAPAVRERATAHATARAEKKPKRAAAGRQPAGQTRSRSRP